MNRVVILVFLMLLGAVQVWQPNYATAQSITDEGDGTWRRIHVPILMYHYVSPLPADADAFRIDLTVEPPIFQAHLQYLSENGYTTISLYDLHQALNLGTPLPPNPIVLTFDDSYIDHYTVVYPLLRSFGFTGTFFVITGRADQNNPQHLSWSEIREMADGGMSMEGHTRTHQDLRSRDLDFLIFEIIGSLESIHGHINQPVRMFSYPAGRYDDDTLRVLNSSDVLRAVTTQNGAYHTTDNAMELRRLRINGNLSVAGLDQLLRSSR